MEITGTINVTELSAVDKLNDTDTLLLIRKEGESQKCYRIAGSDFRGKRHTRLLGMQDMKVLSWSGKSRLKPFLNLRFRLTRSLDVCL